MELKLILEAILFSAQKPLSLKELRDVFAAAVEHAEGDETARGLKKVKEPELIAALEELAKDHEAAQRSYRLACVAGAARAARRDRNALLVEQKTQFDRLPFPLV